MATCSGILAWKVPRTEEPDGLQSGLKEFGVVASDTTPWGIKDFHKCWLGSLAKRRPCLGPVRGSTLIETAHPG